MPEYVHVEENLHKYSSGGVLVESKLLVQAVEINDVGYYVCVYSSTLHLYDDTNPHLNNSMYLYVTG